MTFSDGVGSTAGRRRTFDTHANGWWRFGDADGLAAAETYNILATAVASSSYAVTMPTSPGFVSACTGSNTIPMVDDGTGTGDQLSVPLSAPAGFKFYGADVDLFTVSSSGWLTFAAPPSTAVPVNVAIPNAALPNQMIAPFWTNLSSSSPPCLATDATSATIESSTFDLNTFASVVAQVRLDGSTGVITFAYDATDMQEFGDDATIGLEDLGATAKSQQVLFDTATLDVTKSIVFTPQP